MLFGGTSRVTTLPAPTMAFSPIVTLARIVEPEPIEALAEVPDGPPLRFRWRRVLHDVAAIEGPERIAQQETAVAARIGDPSVAPMFLA